MPKLVLITGGSRGIGAELVRSFAANNYLVAMTYCLNANAATELAEELGPNVCAFHLDQSIPESINTCVNAIEHHFSRTIDILINNGAIAQEKPYLEITANDFEVMLNTNLRGPFLLTQACIPAMQANTWGKVINISSIGGQWGGFNQVHYAAAKAGLLNLTKSIAKIYSADGINCNAISIGLVETEMTRNELASELGKQKVAAIPAKRLGHTSDINAIALFLASDDSNYLCGQTLNANGGMYFS